MHQPTTDKESVDKCKIISDIIFSDQMISDNHEMTPKISAWLSHRASRFQDPGPQNMLHIGFTPVKTLQELPESAPKSPAGGPQPPPWDHKKVNLEACKIQMH